MPHTRITEARKYGLHFRLAGQFLGQAEPRLQQSILVNCGSTIVFRCSADDAERMARHLTQARPGVVAAGREVLVDALWLEARSKYGVALRGERLAAISFGHPDVAYEHGC